MISTIQGTLRRKQPTELLLEVGGVGFSIHVPLSTFEKAGEIGSTLLLHTHLHVREDALQLFGFSTAEERDVFRLLLSVTGIGPKMGQSILSGIAVNELRSYVTQGNLAALTTVPGIGKKLAERIVLELREKFSKLDGRATAGEAGSAPRVHEQALLALTSLGYGRVAAEQSIRGALKELGDNEVTVEVLLKAALRHAGGH